MTNKTEDIREDDAAWDAAMGFVLELHETPEDPRLIEQLMRWLDEDPSHLEAYQQVEMIWALTGQMDASTADSATEYEPEATDSEPHKAEVVPLTVTKQVSCSTSDSNTAKTSVRNWHKTLVPAAIAACMAWVMLPSMNLSQVLSSAAITTAVGEQKSVTFSDGSTTVLSTRTRMDTRFDDTRRRVSLHSGEAFFRVSKDPQRPFVVATAWGDVTVVGTRFNVRAGLANSLVVTVEEGIVDVTLATETSPRRLQAGDRLTLSETGEVALSLVAIDQIAAWRNQEIIVNNWTIGELIQELERYQPGVTTLLGDSLSEQRISGVFHLNDPLAAMTAAVAPLGGQVRTVGPLTIVSL